MPVSPVLFKLLRIGKLARAIRMITMSTMLLSLQRLGMGKCMDMWIFRDVSLLKTVGKSHQSGHQGVVD